MTWTPPANWTEVQSQLKKSGQVTLDANGNGSVTFDPDNARQRWDISAVVVKTNQPANATVVPVATLVMNGVDITQSSPGNQRGATYSGNQDTFQGSWDIGPCDFMSVVFSAAPGQDGTQMAGVIATVIVTGSKYTRRA